MKTVPNGDELLQRIEKVQNGDVLLRLIEKAPEGVKSHVQQHHLVLAHGESGHSHVIDKPGTEMFEVAGKSFVFLPDGATLTHEEHKPIDIPPGVWELGRVREFDYFQQMARPIQD